jgi:hypothetical protein
MQKSRPRKAVCKVVLERTNSAATSRKLWKGLVGFNREQAGPLRYSRTVLSVRDEKGAIAWRVDFAILVAGNLY